MKELEYPFDSALILKKRRALKRELIEKNKELTDVRIAFLCGATADDIISSAELFLLNYGIRAIIYKSEYDRWWEDGVFSNAELEAFGPDIVYICTSAVNIKSCPTPGMTDEQTEELFKTEYSRFERLWNALKRFNCTIIQNNFDPPMTAFGGSYDCYNGAGYLTARLNLAFAEYARSRENFYLCDIDRTAAEVGLNNWQDSGAWFMYKYPCARNAAPILAYKFSLIVKSLYGKNKKLLVLDCDNTLWGGVIGDDGADGIVIGKETAEGEAFYAFQSYIKRLSQAGIALAVVSKNDEENALAGINHPEGALNADDFAMIKADWERKDKNLLDIINAIGLTPGAAVFADDNPAERKIVKDSLPEVETPELDAPENYIKAIENGGYFELTLVSSDDLDRKEMYRKNAERVQLFSLASDYGEYLKSLEMRAKIAPFKPLYIQRITQLTNKSNQFNLTTKRYSLAQMQQIMDDENYITLYGKLSDRFGDNGVVSVMIAKRTAADVCEIELWLMSCRVLKRDMEYAMLDGLVKAAKQTGVKKLIGRYIPTAKNKMVKDHYALMGFKKLTETETGESVYELEIENYKDQNKYIKEDKND